MAGSYNSTGYRNSDGIAVVQGQTAVTQATSITTGVTCNAYSGVITTVSQTVAAGASADIVVTNSKVAATDVVDLNIKTHTSAGTFIATVATVAAGSFTVRLNNLHASTAGNNVLVLNFAVRKCEA
jgi:predicted amidohydrolase